VTLLLQCGHNEPTDEAIPANEKDAHRTVNWSQENDPVPAYSLVSTTQADKNPQCPIAAVCISCPMALSSATFQSGQLGEDGSLSAHE
jgi:hypothetical protein